MNKLVEFLVHSNIYLAIGASLSYLSIISLLNFHFRYEIFIIFLLGTFSLYTYNRYAEVEEDRNTYRERTEFIKKNWQLKALAGISFIIIVIITMLENLIALGLIFIVSLIMYFYSAKPLQLKKIFFAKNFVIAFSWALIITFFPIIFEKIFILKTIHLLVFFTIFMATFINTIIFDIRDIKGDCINKIVTLPVKYGITKTKKILLIINTFSMLLLGIMSNVFGASFLLLVPFLYLYIPLCLIKCKNIKIIADILGDGWLIIFGMIGTILYILGG